MEKTRIPGFVILKIATDERQDKKQRGWITTWINYPISNQSLSD